MTLFDFSDADTLKSWHAIDDRVMGGISQSEMVRGGSPQSRMAIFQGIVSDSNNGGFCSVRATLDKPIDAGTKHLWIGSQNTRQWGSKRYYLNLRTHAGFDGMSYRAAFTPHDSLTRHEFTASEFAPVFRGRSVPDAPPLQFTEVRQLGLMIADAQLGAFALLIQDIGVF